MVGLAVEDSCVTHVVMGILGGCTCTTLAEFQRAEVYDKRSVFQSGFIM